MRRCVGTHLRAAVVVAAVAMVAAVVVVVATGVPPSDAMHCWRPGQRQDLAIDTFYAPRMFHAADSPRILRAKSTSSQPSPRVACLCGAMFVGASFTKSPLERFPFPIFT